jgi:hypothetical protein
MTMQLTYGDEIDALQSCRLVRARLILSQNLKAVGIELNTLGIRPFVPSEKI